MFSWFYLQVFSRNHHKGNINQVLNPAHSLESQITGEKPRKFPQGTGKD
jgi:hypothetical protein